MCHRLIWRNILHVVVPLATILDASALLGNKEQVYFVKRSPVDDTTCKNEQSHRTPSYNIAKAIHEILRVCISQQIGMYFLSLCFNVNTTIYLEDLGFEVGQKNRARKGEIAQVASLSCSQPCNFNCRRAGSSHTTPSLLS